MNIVNHKDVLCRTTILVACYEGGNFIDEQIETILRQISVKGHVIVRDDGSVDDTVVRLAALQNRFPEAVEILTDTLGPTRSAAANFFALLEAVDLDNCDFVALADQDDVWLPTKLARAVDVIRAGGGGAYSSDLTSWEPDSDHRVPLRKGGAQVRFDYLFQGASAGCTYVLDREAARLVKERIAGLNRRYCAGVSHDWTIYSICRSAGLRWFHDDQSHILYRQHSANVYGARQGLRGLIARAKMMRSGWYRQHCLWLANVLDNHPSERAIMTALDRLSWRDRLVLAYRCGEFRRNAKEVWFLRVAFLTGLFR